MFFPNVSFGKEQLDFGCILNDTETIRYISMTNNSPLEVRYRWSFLKRPPVQKVLPDHDEGVDMESECEIDSLEEEGEGSEVGGEGEEERSMDGERESSHSRPQSVVHIQNSKDAMIGSNYANYGGSPLEEAADEVHQRVLPREAMSLHIPACSPNHEAAPEEIARSAVCPSPLSSREQPLPQSLGNDNDIIKSGLTHAESEVKVVIVEDAVKKGDTAPTSDDRSETGEKAGLPDKERTFKPQPWELTYDPFTPISIEQVCRVA